MATEIHHCSECVELLGDYVDGLLTADRREALERHLSLCMPCITFVRTYKATSRMAREQLRREMPEELTSSLHQFLKNAIPGFTCESKSGPGGCSGLAAQKAKKA